MELINLSEMPHEKLLREEFNQNLNENTQRLKTILNVPLNEDVIFREFETESCRICVVFIEGMSDENKIGEFILHAVKNDADKSNHALEDDILAHFSKNLLETAQAQTVSGLGDAVQRIVAGMVCVLIDGCGEALIIEARNYPFRAVNQPTGEKVVNGSHEAFNEHLRTNISLIRRYVQSPQLVTRKLTVGTKVPTQLAVVYLEGVASEKCLDELMRRLKSIRSATVQGSGHLEQLIEDSSFALVPQILQTERPDRAASCLKDGQIAILTENSPYALIVPITVFHLLHASDDSFMRWQYGTLLRIVRVLGALISLTLPALYIAMTLHHTHLIPMSLLTSIAESRANVPFPIIVEVLFMEFSLHLLNEAGIRIPSQIGTTLGIVGALILGQAAVSASIISPILIIVVALTGLGNYVIPDFGLCMAILIYRQGLILLSALLGLYGLFIGLFLMMTQLCSMKSFGVDYLSPVSPRRSHNPDIILRLPARMQRKVMYFAQPGSWIRGKESVE